MQQCVDVTVDVTANELICQDLVQGMMNPSNFHMADSRTCCMVVYD
jgi:hypothetical protein